MKTRPDIRARKPRGAGKNVLPPWAPHLGVQAGPGPAAVLVALRAS